MKRILSTLIAFTLMACNLLPHAPDKTDTRMVYVWPTEVCPSLAAGAPSAARSAILAGLATTLIGNVVTGVVGIPAAALAAAADADTQGLKATGTNARFYYQIEKSAVSNTVELIPPSCYVVAYSKPQRNGKHWCEDSTFSNSVTETCREGMTALKQLKVREDLSGNNGPGIEGLSVPEIYLEIGFDSSSYPDVVRPKIVAMHYPNSVIQPNSDEPRAISLQLDFTSPQKDDPLKAAAQVVMVIPSVKPASPVDAFSLSNVITGWTSIPTKGVQPTTVPTEKSKYLPVTIKATLNEVGDPHAFLQAFAKAFGSNSSQRGQSGCCRARDRANWKGRNCNPVPIAKDLSAAIAKG